VGVGLLAFTGPEGLSRPLVQLGLPLLLIAGIIYWRVQRWRSASKDGPSSPYWATMATRMWRPQGSGFYALIAAVTFVGFQGEMLLDRTRALWATWQTAPYTDGGAFVDFLSSQLWSGLTEMLVSVSAETILNVVMAGLWPLSWLQHYGIVVAAGALMLTYAAYRFARRRFSGFNAFMQQVDVSGEADRPAASRIGSGR